MDQSQNILLRQRLQFKDPRSRKKRTIHFEIRILCCRTDQDHRAVFHIWQQVVLLCLIEPVNLVNKENRLSSVAAQVLFRLCDNLLKVLLSRYRCIHLMEICSCRPSDHTSKGCFPHARRSIKDDRADPICFDRTVKKLVFPDNILLANHLLQSLRTHPGSKRSLLFFLALCNIFKKIHLLIRRPLPAFCISIQLFIILSVC